MYQKVPINISELKCVLQNVSPGQRVCVCVCARVRAESHHKFLLSLVLQSLLWRVLCFQFQHDMKVNARGRGTSSMLGTVLVYA